MDAMRLFYKPMRRIHKTQNALSSRIKYNRGSSRIRQTEVAEVVRLRMKLYHHCFCELPPKSDDVGYQALILPAIRVKVSVRRRC
jgi:hypothetical protein